MCFGGVIQRSFGSLPTAAGARRPVPNSSAGTWAPMPTFAYTAKDRSGQNVEGTVEAADQASAVAELRERGIYVLRVAVRRQRRQEASLLVKRFLDPIFFRVSLRQLAFVFHELHAMTNAGVSLAEALALISRDLRPARLQAVVTDLAEATRRGEFLSQNMRRFPTIFTEIMVAMVEAGERSGDLAGMFRSIAEWLDYEANLRSRIFTATLYPKVVLVVALIAAVVVAKAELAQSSPRVLALFVAGAVALAIAGWFVYKGSERWLEQFGAWRRSWDAIKLAVPGVGGMVRKFCVARFCRTMACLYRAGLLMDTSIQSAANACGNIAMRDRILPVVPEVMRGVPLAQALQRTGQFPPSVLHIIATGEETGDLDTLLDKVADYASNDADTTAQRMIPVLVVVTFVLVAVLVLFQLLRFYLGYFQGLLGGEYG